jgi:hypothetical protein
MRRPGLTAANISVTLKAAIKSSSSRKSLLLTFKRNMAMLWLIFR